MIEAVTLFKQTQLIILVVGGCLLLFVFVEGAQIVPLMAVSSSSYVNKVSGALATGLTLILFVIACVMLYIQQRLAHQRDQVILGELETAHAQLKTTHDQLEATHRQLEEYATQVEDLTLITERQRLARELHDTLAQGLVGLTMQLETIDALLLKQQCHQAHEIVQQAMARARAAIEDLRTEARDEQQFAQMVQNEIQRFTSATGITCTCSLPETLALPAAFHEHFLRLVTEGLMNIARHAQATHAWVYGTCDQDTFTFEIVDNGIGFDPRAVTQQAGHYGLLGLRERARLLHGQLDILSAPVQGTTLRLHLPDVNGETRDERTAIRVMVVDDHLIVREGLRMMFGTGGGRIRAGGRRGRWSDRSTPGGGAPDRCSTDGCTYARNGWTGSHYPYPRNLTADCCGHPHYLQ